MGNKVYTIGREFGSMGHLVGEKLAERLGIKCYDKELLQKAAKDSGFCEEIFENHDEKPASSFLYSLVMDTYSPGSYSSTPFLDMPLNHKVFLAQFDTIKNIAENESCVIVGRCADYALNDLPNHLSIFIYGEEAAKAKRVSETDHMSFEDAKDECAKRDKQRQSYYNYYSDKKWGRADSYDLCIDSGKLGIDGTVDLIVDYINRLEK